MVNQKLKKLTLTQQKYQRLAKRHEPSRSIWRNFAFAFFVGGAISLLGQVIQTIFTRYFGFSEQAAGNPTVAILIFLSALFTGLGLFDKLARYAGAGTAIPVTGFANSIVSAAMDARSEGYVMGVAASMFKLAGSVIVSGVVAAFFIGLIRTLLTMGD